MKIFAAMKPWRYQPKPPFSNQPSKSARQNVKPPCLEFDIVLSHLMIKVKVPDAKI
jgi:hypothetical protein